MFDRDKVGSSSTPIAIEVDAGDDVNPIRIDVGSAIGEASAIAE